MLLAIDTWENIGRFVVVLFIFVLVLGMTYFTTRYIADYQKNKIINGNIKVIETFQIAPNKYIQIIGVGKKYFAIAVSKDNVTLLGNLEEGDFDISNTDSNMPSFKDIIEIAKNKINHQDNTGNAIDCDDKKEE